MPDLLGQDPTEIGCINSVMDAALLGHPYAKSPLHMACWDLLGQQAGMPLCSLLGGRCGEAVVFYRAMDAINLKISKVGSLTKARQIRDLCVALGLPMTIEDSWGGDIVTAAIAHLAHSTPERFRFTATDFNSYVTVSNASGAPMRREGTLRASDRPGLGVSANRDVLGRPVAEYRA